MNIRIAEERDLEAIVEIYNQAIAAGNRTADTVPVSLENRKEWFSEHDLYRYPILVAEENDTVFGYCTLSAHRPGRAALRHTAEVSYYVHFDYHRRGIASRLLQYVIELCPSLQIKTLFAILLESNGASISFLERHGFEKWGHLPRVADFDGEEVGQFYYGLRIENAKKHRT